MEMLCLFQNERTSALNQLCSGKVLLGILVVTTTTGGFTLGYFVGKNPSSPPAPAAVRQQLNEAGSVSPASVPGSDAAGDSSPAVPVVQDPSAAAKQSELASSVPQKSPVNMEAKDEKRAGLARAQTPSGADAPMSSGEKGIHRQTVRSQNTKDSNQSASGTPASEGSGEVSEPAGSSPGRVLYTVQAGAFRNQKDAAVLKHRLEESGYKASIRKETNAKGVVFFRVRTGEFESRKEASLVALKLKKTDGLSAFATEKK
jgi:cell division septation protein DedD